MVFTSAPSRRRARRGDWIAICVLAGLALLVFALPSLLGRPVLPGDDMTQNYPLRVLAGQEIRAGHLPVYNPYIWSGAPLLAGWNAAAAYPLTWLFAILPGVAAWTAGLVATYVAAAVGMYAFLRLGLRLRPVASFAGALAFAFGGAMAAQVTHFGVVSGMAWVPLGLLAVSRLTDSHAGPPGSGRRLTSGAWAALLGLAMGLTILAGEPRSIADAIVVIGLYSAWRLVALGTARGRRSLPAAGWVATGLALGIALSAVQVLPGLAAISTSQRAAASLALFSSGSLPDRWLVLMLVPDLLGGSGTLSQPGFFGFYNLTEVDGYAGILPLVAAFALLARLRGASLRRLPEWVAWHVMAIVGVALALGGNTPLGPLLASLPFYGTQRLQSRNLLVLDLALAVLLAYWADQPFPSRERQPKLAFLGALPAVAVIAVAVAGIAYGPALVHWLDGNDAISAASIEALRPWLVPYLVLGAAALALVIAGRRLPARLLGGVVAGFVAVDAIAFSALAVVQIAPGPAAGSTPPVASASAASAPAASPPSRPPGHASGAAVNPSMPHLPVRPVASLGYPGRFAIYDPDLADTADLSILEPPDLNSIGGTASVQGYTSIVDGRYAAATGSHQATGDGQDTLSPAAIGDGTLDDLDTTVLLTLPQYADGTLKDVLKPPHWVLRSWDGGFEVFWNTSARAALTLQALPGRSAAGASVSDVQGPVPTDPTSATVRSGDGVRVVRSVSGIAGWTASWQPAHGAALSVPVQADGVVQAVDVPPGTGKLTWSYAPPRLGEGLAVSLTAAVVIALLGLAPLWRRGRPAAAPPAQARPSDALASN